MPFSAWKKVLLVDLGFLGDTVHSIPAMRALAEAGIRVDVMTTPVGAQLLRLVPGLGQIWEVPLRKPSPAPWKSLGMILKIRLEKYDASLSLVGSDRNLYCVSASGSRERLAHLTGNNSWPARWNLTRSVSARDRGMPVFEQRLSVLRELGWRGIDPGWSWEIPPSHQGWVREKALSPLIHLSVNAASTPLNEWPLNDWAKVMKAIWRVRPEIRVVATGAGSERESARLGDLVALAQDARLVTLPGRLDVPHLAALLQASDLHLGLDSGVLHLAMALGKPTVSLFRESPGRPGWAPRGSRHCVLLAPCPCHQHGRMGCQGGQSQCLGKIRPEEVSEAAIASLSPKGAH